jgi:hypothetical protein
MSRKQMRHSPKRRYTARARPQRRHRVYARTLNLGFRCCFWINAFFAMYYPSLWRSLSRRNGKPSAVSSARPSSSVVAVVTIVMSMPRTVSMLS